MQEESKDRLIKSWLGWLIEEHQGRWPDAGWPAEGSQDARMLWSEWLNALIAVKATRAQAQSASTFIDAKGVHWEEHIGLMVHFIAECNAITAVDKMKAAVASAAGGYNAAAAASHDCPRCDGSGQVDVFYKDYDGRRIVRRLCRLPNGKEQVIPFNMLATAQCVCAMGRFLRGKTPPELLPRIPDLVEVLEGKTPWLPEDPTLAGVGDEIVFPENVGDMREYWRYMVAAMAAQGELGKGGPIRARDGKYAEPRLGKGEA
jgi:hypothetical protein